MVVLSDRCASQCQANIDTAHPLYSLSCGLIIVKVISLGSMWPQGSCVGL